MSGVQLAIPAQKPRKRPLQTSEGMFLEAKKPRQDGKQQKVMAIPMINRQKDDSLPADAPMLIKNMIPGIGEIKDEKERFLRDMQLRPQELKIDDDSYSRVPIEDFGAAMLRGMGWDPKKGVGAEGNQRVVKPTLYESRPSLLGLGAVPKPEELDHKKRRRRNDDTKDHPPWLCLNALVKVKAGRYQGEYAVVYQLSGVEGKKGSVIIQLDPGSSSSVNKLPQVIVESGDLALVDHNKLSRQHAGRVLLERAKEERTKVSQPSSKKDKKSKKKKHKSKESRPVECWLFPGIRVRVVSRSLKDGLYYTKKGTVTLVTDPRKGRCTLEMREPRANIDDVDQKYLETALPKTNGKVLIVQGSHKGKAGVLIERNSKKGRVKVQFNDDLSVHKFSFDDVAELVYSDH